MCNSLLLRFFRPFGVVLALMELCFSKYMHANGLQAYIEELSSTATPRLEGCQATSWLNVWRAAKKQKPTTWLKK